jgi:GNAT superfamily N-acetyltransferase
VDVVVAGGADREGFAPPVRHGLGPLGLERPGCPEIFELVDATIWQQGWRDGHLGRVPAELTAARQAESYSARAAQRVDDTTVAVDHGHIAGFDMVAGNEFEQVYVASDHRGSGVAALLLDDAERQIKDAGHSTAWLAVVPGNTRARSMASGTASARSAPSAASAPLASGSGSHGPR